MTKTTPKPKVAPTTISETLRVLRQQKAGFHDGLRELWARIDALEAERRALLDGPLCKEDWLHICLAIADRHADAFAAKLAGYLHGLPAERLISSGRMEFSMADALAVLYQGGEERATVRMLSGGEYRQAIGGPFSDAAPWFFFRDAIKAGVQNAFDRMPEGWHFPDAKSAEAVLPVLNAIEAELAELRSEEQALTSEASHYGIDLPVRLKPPAPAEVDNVAAPSVIPATAGTHEPTPWGNGTT